MGIWDSIGDHPRMPDAIDDFDRVVLTRTPTPLQHLPYLSAQLGLTVRLKRDDPTDLALGGDKPRKLGYELADPVREGADWLVGCGSAQSNFARLLAAAARGLGLGCSVVLAMGEHREDQGNLLVVRLMGAEVHLVNTEDVWDLDAACQVLCEDLRRRGHRPHFVPVSGTTARSCLGYVGAGVELSLQLDDLGLHHAVYVPFGTGGIAAGMAVGLREAAQEVPLIGCSVNRPARVCVALFNDWVCQIEALLELQPSSITIDARDDQLGEGHGKVTHACLGAIYDFARFEAILLDPVYSGEVGASFLADARSDRWARDACDPAPLRWSSGGIRVPRRDPGVPARERQLKSGALQSPRRPDGRY
jgi:D-cysteine desulfhydrase